MVVAFVETAMSNIRYKAQDANMASLRPEAYSALEVTLAQIQEYQIIKEKLHNVSPAWNIVTSERVQFPEGMQIGITVKDIGSRVGINSIQDRDKWIRMIEDLGVSSYDTESLADALMDWMDTDETTRPFGAERDDYLDADSKLLPPNEAIQSLDEIEYIEGFKEVWYTEEGALSEFARTFKSAFSTLTQNPPNVNTAPKSVLTLLTGSELEADAIIDHRNGSDGLPGTLDDEIIESSYQLESLGFNLQEEVSYEISQLLIETKVFWKGAEFTLSALVELSSSELAGSNSSTDGAYPFTILKLTENSRFSDYD